LALVRDLVSEKPEKVKIYAKTIGLYLRDDELLEYDDYINRIKQRVKEIVFDF